MITRTRLNVISTSAVLFKAQESTVWYSRAATVIAHTHTDTHIYIYIYIYIYEKKSNINWGNHFAFYSNGNPELFPPRGLVWCGVVCVVWCSVV